jgi:hypothetical protein
LITSHKLCHYFDTYPIEVVTKFPLGDILCNKDANGRIIKWALELSPYLLEFKAARPSSHKRWSTSLSNGQI